MSNVFRLLGVVLIGVFLNASYAGAGWFDKKTSQEQPKPAKEQPTPAPAPVTKTPSPAPQKEMPKVVSEIPWAEVHKKFISKDRDLTSAQKEKMERDRKNWWNESYKGKWVRWRGSVRNVSSSGGSIQIDMGEGSWGADIMLNVDPAAREKAAELNKDSYVTFVGRMSDQPGSIAAMELLEVTIE